MLELRNVAIIAHVDHGKTTLVDRLIHECKALDGRNETTDQVLDHNDLEKERGITILSKNVSVMYSGVKINIIDTPGHADFGGEVERVLKMADGVLLLVDAFEGVMPQTRFVLGKALDLGLRVILVVNKVDKENCRPDEVHEEVFDLMFSLDASEEQLEFPTFFGSSKNGWMSKDWKVQTQDMQELLKGILAEIPPAPMREGSLQMQITSMDHSNYVGKIAIGRVYRGEIAAGNTYSLCTTGGVEKVKIKEIHEFVGLGKNKVDTVRCGDICALVGLDKFDIGDTIADVDNPEELPRISVDEPTMGMLFSINNSPFYGQEGKFVTSRHIRDRLFKETEINLALRVEETDREDQFNVYGRGVLHLSILVETMRREGFELQVGKPKVLMKEKNGVKLEPFEVLVVDVPEDYSGKVIELATSRKGSLLKMETKGDMHHLEFDIPSRGLIGLRNQVLTSTAGEAVMTHRFRDYDKYAGELSSSNKGALVSMETGPSLAYAIDRLQDRGRFFVEPGDQIYKGQVVGEHTRDNDLPVNLIKGKKLTNMRAAGSDDNSKIAPKIVFSLEEAMEYIKDDEFLEVTPTSLRMRKKKF